MLESVADPSYNSILQFGATILLGVTGFFLRGVASDLKEIKKQQDRDGNRITALEAVQSFTHSHHPMRREGDSSLVTPFRSSGPRPQEG